MPESEDLRTISTNLYKHRNKPHRRITVIIADVNSVVNKSKSAASNNRTTISTSFAKPMARVLHRPTRHTLWEGDERAPIDILTT